MITTISRVLSMSKPIAGSEHVAGIPLMTATESFLRNFRPSPQGTVWFPEVHPVRVNERRDDIVPSRKRLLFARDTLKALQASTNLIFLDAGRVLSDKGYRLLKAPLEDYPLGATVHHPWRLSTSRLNVELELPPDVAFEDGFPAREVPNLVALEEQPSSQQGSEPLRRIVLDMASQEDTRDSIEVSEFHRGAKRTVTVFYSPERGLQTFYHFSWQGAPIKELKAFLRLPIETSLTDLGRELVAVIGASGLYEENERKHLVFDAQGDEFWIRSELPDKAPAFEVEGHSEADGGTLIARLSLSEMHCGGEPMPLPPSLFNLLWKGIFDFTD